MPFYICSKRHIISTKNEIRTCPVCSKSKNAKGFNPIRLIKKNDLTSEDDGKYVYNSKGEKTPGSAGSIRQVVSGAIKQLSFGAPTIPITSSSGNPLIRKPSSNDVYPPLKKRKIESKTPSNLSSNPPVKTDRQPHQPPLVIDLTSRDNEKSRQQLPLAKSESAFTVPGFNPSQSIDFGFGVSKPSSKVSHYPSVTVPTVPHPNSKVMSKQSSSNSKADISADEYSGEVIDRLLKYFGDQSPNPHVHVLPACLGLDSNLLSQNQLESRFTNYISHNRNYNKNRIVFIPVNLGRHWVALLLDIEANADLPKSIIYIDPYGNPILELKPVIKRLFPEIQCVSTKTQLQKEKDVVNCGPYVVEIGRYLLEGVTRLSIIFQSIQSASTEEIRVRHFRVPGLTELHQRMNREANLGFGVSPSIIPSPVISISSNNLSSHFMPSPPPVLRIIPMGNSSLLSKLNNKPQNLRPSSNGKSPVTPIRHELLTHPQFDEQLNNYFTNNKGLNNVSFCYDINAPHKIYYASSTEPNYPSIINLMQGITELGTIGDYSSWYLFTKQSSNPMAIGMLDYLSRHKKLKTPSMLRLHNVKISWEQSASNAIPIVYRQDKSGSKPEQLQLAAINYSRDNTRLNNFAAFIPNTQPNVSLYNNTHNDASTHTLHRLYMMAAYGLVQARNYNGNVNNKSVGGGYKVGALLVSDAGQILACGLNTSYVGFTLHAEVNMLQSYIAKNGAPPNNCRIYTTLKPCEMCAGMIAHFCNNAVVYYSQNDPGANNTFLDIGTNGCVQYQLDDRNSKALRPYQVRTYSDHLHNKTPPLVSPKTFESTSNKIGQFSEQIIMSNASNKPNLGSTLSNSFQSSRNRYNTINADKAYNQHITTTTEFNSVIQYLNKSLQAQFYLPLAINALYRKFDKYSPLTNSNQPNKNVLAVLKVIREFLIKIGYNLNRY